MWRLARLHFLFLFCFFIALKLFGKYDLYRFGLGGQWDDLDGKGGGSPGVNEEENEEDGEEGRGEDEGGSEEEGGGATSEEDGEEDTSTLHPAPASLWPQAFSRVEDEGGGAEAVGGGGTSG